MMIFGGSTITYILAHIRTKIKALDEILHSRFGKEASAVLRQPTQFLILLANRFPKIYPDKY